MKTSVLLRKSEALPEKLSTSRKFKHFKKSLALLQNLSASGAVHPSKEGSAYCLAWQSPTVAGFLSSYW
jgi:hypothetical protein